MDARSRTSSLRCASGASSSGTLNGHTPIHQTIRGFQKVVTRIDFVDQSGQTGKSFYSPGLQEGTPLLVLGDDGACPIVIVEGEAKADDLFEALYTDEGLRLPSHAVASYPHGSGSAHKADYSAVAGRKVIVWPDNDETGQDAGRKVWSACSSAGAAELWLVRGPAPDDLNVKPTSWPRWA